MMILLYILIGLGSLIGLVLLVAAFSKKGYAIEREVVIRRPVRVVYDYVRMIKNQDHFNKWVQTDPKMQKHYRGEDGTVGFIYGWNGNKQAGEGEQEIKGLVQDSLVDLEVRFVRPMAAVAQTPMTLKAVNDGETRLVWGMRSQMKYPVNIVLLFMDMDKLLGKDLEQSMSKLKHILEA